MPHLDAQTLLGAADILITDYSSCFFDYMIRNKPIIHFAYDYDYYKNQDRGLYYEIGEVAAGSVAYCQQDLFRAVEDNLISDVEHQRREKVREKFITYESPDSCKQIMEQIQKRIKQ
jgi:CDP-glycerol glycerophosphotransferase